MDAALKLAIEAAEDGQVVAEEAGVFISAYAGDGGSLVQMHADGTFDVDGIDRRMIPAQYRERVAALLAEEWDLGGDTQMKNDESDIIIVSDHVEIHPGRSEGDWLVVRDGAVYGGPYGLEFARGLADELAREDAQEDRPA